MVPSPICSAVTGVYLAKWYLPVHEGRGGSDQEFDPIGLTRGKACKGCAGSGVRPLRKTEIVGRLFHAVSLGISQAAPFAARIRVGRLQCNTRYRRWRWTCGVWGFGGVGEEDGEEGSVWWCGDY